jgi:hydrogenase expression/formation protein HypE
VTLAHGGGGSLTQALVRDVFAATLGTDTRHDGAELSLGDQRLVTTTDAFVVRPLFFPGGDIGALAVHGTVNDLAMCGARTIALTAAFIIEEGFPVEDLTRIVRSMAVAASALGIAITSGDTKVVERGHGDGLYITTAGVGLIEHAGRIHPDSIRAGDAILLSGDIGRHGMAVLCARDGLTLEPPVASDQQALWPAIAALLDADIELHCLRDLTRGGLATCAIELAEAAGLNLALEETAIAVPPQVQAGCDLLGLDPLYIANEGRFITIVAAADADRALDILTRRPDCAGAVHCGHVVNHQTGRGPARVRLRTQLGTWRHIALLSGAQLPRIC